MVFRHPPKKIFSWKLLFYFLGGMAGICLGLFFIVLIGRGQSPEDNPALMVAMVALFAIAPFGAFWMMKTALHEEPKPWPLISLACFVPFAFLWYYFERVKPARLTSQE